MNHRESKQEKGRWVSTRRLETIIAVSYDVDLRHGKPARSVAHDVAVLVPVIYERIMLLEPRLTTKREEQMWMW